MTTQTKTLSFGTGKMTGDSVKVENLMDADILLVKWTAPAKGTVRVRLTHDAAYPETQRNFTLKDSAGKQVWPSTPDRPHTASSVDLRMYVSNPGRGDTLKLNAGEGYELTVASYSPDAGRRIDCVLTPSWDIPA